MVFLSPMDFFMKAAQVHIKPPSVLRLSKYELHSVVCTIFD